MAREPDRGGAAAHQPRAGAPPAAPWLRVTMERASAARGGARGRAREGAAHEPPPVRRTLKGEEVLCFLHIPKTGGTSLNAVLEEWFRPDEICPFLEERFAEEAKKA